MQPHSIVVISLQSPKEKLWGELIDITPVSYTHLDVYKRQVSRNPLMLWYLNSRREQAP